MRLNVGPRVIRVGEVPGSNPGAPIKKPRKCGVFCWANRAAIGQGLGIKARGAGQGEAKRCL